MLQGVMVELLAFESLFLTKIDCMMSVGVVVDIFAISFRTAAQQWWTVWMSSLPFGAGKGGVAYIEDQHSLYHYPLNN